MILTLPQDDMIIMDTYGALESSQWYVDVVGFLQR